MSSLVDTGKAKTNRIFVRHSKEFIAKVIECYVNCNSAREVCKRYKVAEPTVNAWMTKYWFYTNKDEIDSIVLCVRSKV